MSISLARCGAAALLLFGYPCIMVAAEEQSEPDTTAHRLPEEGAPYELDPGLSGAPPGFRVRVEEPDRPSRFFADSDAGFRLTTFWKGWDLSFNYMYRYDDLPTAERSVSLLGPRPEIRIKPVYDRTHLVGASFSNAFGNLTLRGELAFTTGKRFPTASFFDQDGVIESDRFQYVLGFDWFGFSDWFLSAQFFQDIVIDNDPGLIRDQVENRITAVARRSFINDNLVFETTALHSIDNGDGLIRPKLSYALNDVTTIWMAADIFYGSESGVFGQFDQRDRLVLGAEFAW